MNTVRWIAPFIIGLSLGVMPELVKSNSAQAQNSASAPAELKALVTQVDQAANSRNLDGVMALFAANFTHSDGLTRDALEKTLTELWQLYPQLNHQTEILSWKKEGNAFVVETKTTLTGSKPLGNQAKPEGGMARTSRELKLNSTLRSRQRWENQKLVRQEILSERTMMTSGANPPTVKVLLPEQVKTGQQYSFDTIVSEPLGTDLLLGGVADSAVKPANYLTPEPMDLEVLSAGGLFKQGVAPTTPDNRWISAVLIRGDGITMITQRLRVVR